MHLTCPTCRSGLQVPDGTTANVRCPTCRTIFLAAAGIAPPPPPPPARRPVPAKPPADDWDRPRPGKAKPRDEDEDDRPRRARRDDEEDDDRPRKQQRDDDDDRSRGRRARDEVEKKTRKRRRFDDDDDKLSPEEKRRRVQAFARGMWGSRLIAVSLLFYILSMLVILLFFVSTAVAGAVPAFIVVAGVLGLVNWVLGAVGLGLCISGPASPGHYRFAIAAAVAIFVHLILLLAQVNKGEGFAGSKTDLDRSSIKWAQVPTKLDSLTFYLAYVGYADRIPVQRSDAALSFATGVAEMCRTMLILLTLAGLALAAGDKQLSHRCTRAAGVMSFGPGAMALVMLLFIVAMIETGAESLGVFVLLLLVMIMGIYAIIAGMLTIALGAVRDTAEACEFPYQSDAIDLGG